MAGSLTISVECGTSNPSGSVSIVCTFDGTLPDIHNAKRASSCGVRFNTSYPTPIVMARCIADGKIPSRIAYMQRMIWDDAVNGSYYTKICNENHYRELDLPRCDPAIGGSLCDGQSIVVLPSTPTKSATPIMTSSSGMPTYATVLSTPTSDTNSKWQEFCSFIFMLTLILVILTL
jgi:hypothetical protein